MKTLCYVNHYFGEPRGFEGRSTTNGDAEHRRAVVLQCLAALRALPEAEVYVCGTDGRSVVPVDIDFSEVRDRPKLLIYESLARMAGRVDEGFDYFINIEDDILLPRETFESIVKFDQDSLLNEILLPNRMERRGNGELFCPDLWWMPGWTYQRRRHQDRHIRVAINPHSGLLILSREKLRYALGHIDTAYRGRIIGAEMASAYAHYHSPFSLYRSYEGLSSHAVIHLDGWAGQSLLSNPEEAERAATLDVMLAGQKDHVATLEGALSAQRDHAAALEAALADAMAFRTSVLASKSWRLTRPIRGAGIRLRKHVRKLAALKSPVWLPTERQGLRREAWLPYWLAYRIRRRTQGKRWLLVGPDEVQRHYLLWKVAHLLGVELVRFGDHAAPLAFRFHDTTISTAASPVAEKVLNGACTDISKRRLEVASLATFGYGVAVDPTEHVGPMVEKSDRNAVHDGAVIDGPIDTPDPSKAYQRVLDNEVQPGVVEDLRVTIVGARIPIVFRKHRPLQQRFANVNTHAELAEAATVLSPAECAKITALADHIGLDMGDMDVVRDRTDGRVYVVDVNNTAVSPPEIAAGGLLGLRAMRLVARAFEREWGTLLPRAED